MNDILTDYREWRDAQPTRVSTHSDGCHMWHKDCMIHRLADALKRARLTDAEREAIECGIQAIGLAPYDERTLAYADTLRTLLERTK
jgi:hypothetical protein